MTLDIFPPSTGQLIAIDAERSVSAELPDAWSAIPTAASGCRSTVGVVTKLHDDGCCEAKLVCNCSGGKCTKRCGSGSVVKGLSASQRQIVCSSCTHANLPHALPALRCEGCAKSIPSDSSYKRAPPVGDSHKDLCLCEPCFGKRFGSNPDPNLNPDPDPDPNPNLNADPNRNIPTKA